MTATASAVPPSMPMEQVSLDARPPSLLLPQLPTMKVKNFQAVACLHFLAYSLPSLGEAVSPHQYLPTLQAPLQANLFRLEDFRP